MYQGNPVKEIPEGAVGFVYLITNRITGQGYIGKKFCYSRTRIKISGKKRRKVVVKESKWRDYTGSNEPLNDDINKLGLENFSREILQFFPTKKEVSYCEVEEQITRKVLTALLPSGLRAYYNRNILGKWFCAPEKQTEQSNQKRSETLKGHPVSEKSRKKMSAAAKIRPPMSEETKKRLSEISMGNKHSAGHHNHLGKKASEETKRKLSESHLGISPWNKGKQFSEESRKKMSEAAKKRYMKQTTPSQLNNENVDV
jgi:Putative endonuclease segE, GIY-YIG domain/NUMOD3 motif